MSSESDPGALIKTCIEGLRRYADGIDHDDLPRLAKMHEVCGGLIGGAKDAAVELPPEVDQHARFMVGALEALILGESEDPAGVLAEIVKRISALEGPSSESPAQPSNKSVDAGELDDVVAARLARVFEDQPESEDTQTGDAARDESTPAGGPTAVAATPDQCDDQPAPPSQPAYVSEPLQIDKSEMEIVVGFVEEANEHLDAVEAAVLAVERAPEDADAINALFRPFHTIKGAAGFLNLGDIVSLTHEAETLLDQARKGDREITPGLIDLIFEVVDILKVQIAAIGNYCANPSGDVVPQPPVEVMIAGLRDVVAGRVEPCGGAVGEGAADQKVGDNLVENGAVARDVVDFAVSEQARSPSPKKVGESLIDMGVATPKQVSQALRSQAQAVLTAKGTASSGGDQSVRIDTAKLDALVDMVGELVIAQTQVGASPTVEGDPKLLKDVTQVGKIVRDVQDVAMAMRMIPIGPTFQKMARLIRDVSRKVGKTVELTISGEETELDKNVIQQIGDPLVHMVRNAVDHGIETAEARRAAGKPEAGQVHLGAFHRGGNIVIEINDDGHGLDPQALIEKGIERGVLQPGETLSDEQAYQLIFAPGFSMAKQVTGISGRGVGMDVARRNIEQLRGKVEISSQLGKGSTFSIQLPLTLAIIDGMVVRVGSERFIIQTISVEQALRPRPEQITTVQRKGAVLNVRGRLIPLVQLGSLFGLTEPLDPSEAIVVIAQGAGSEIGLVVDELLGQQQVVIKTLGERFKSLRGISGAAILGDGRVGLILEVSGVAAAHNTRPSANWHQQVTEEAKSGNVQSPSAEAGQQTDDAKDQAGELVSA